MSNPNDKQDTRDYSQNPKGHEASFEGERQENESGRSLPMPGEE